MPDDLRELYQEVILEHNKKPRNFHALPEPVQKSEGYNPLCGDKVTVYMQVEGDQVKDVSFQGSGCAISKASASLMTTAVKGKRLEEVRALFDRFHHVVSGQGNVEEIKALGTLAVLAGVSEFPARVKCATLAWHTLKAAMENSKTRISTE